MNILSSWLLLLFSCLTVSNSLWPHGLKYARIPCLSPSPRACSNSCPLSQWCHPTISSSVIPFSSCLLSFPAPGSFPVNQLFPSGGQSIGASASVAVLPMNIQGWFLLGLTGWISLQSRELSGVVSNTTVWKHQFFSLLLCPGKFWKEHFLGSYHKTFWFSRTRLKPKNHLWSFTVIRLARRVP